MTDTSPTRFQTFTASTSPDQGPPRLAKLREEMAAEGYDAFIVPRSDAHQGEYVPARDERLAWLTGFTGSAGFAVALKDRAAVFTDGRYTLQVRSQTDQGSFEPVPWPKTKLEDWLAEALPRGGTVAYDPWLHTMAEVTRLEKALGPKQIGLRPSENLIDRIWEDQPDAPVGKASIWPDRLAGRSAAEKIKLVAADLAKAGHAATVLTQPDSIAWALNIRGGDIPHTPLMLAFAILHSDGQMDVFTEPSKLYGFDLPNGVAVHRPEAFKPALEALHGPVRLDPSVTAAAISATLEASGIETVAGDDPCRLPKAIKHPAEIAATQGAHLRDGAAVARFLHWFDETAPKGGLTEIDCVRALEGFRSDTGALRDVSFDTIAGAGPNGAIVHYRVTDGTNATIRPGQLFLIDSGAQYEDGTTDITRTLPVGEIGAEEREAFTQVLRGMIAVSRARFPKGLAGRDLDALARAPLWAAGRDYDHGTGHGVGVFLGVHEGPQRLSRISDVALEPGMILSNEPGYYREGRFGIRIENLLVVIEAPDLPGADDREMLAFDTLTFAPIDRRLIDRDALSALEIRWLDEYHREVAEKIGPLVEGPVAEWLAKATAPL
ncbi:M24 family metallopeptidase [Rhodobacterales bacterium HKCCE3408]|nr:M24 family metallopeptidase [Rhodobacterales bacterium HKCCE3408]